MTAKVGVVTTSGCPHCKRAKAALKEKGVEYAEADLGKARDILAKVKETTGQSTVPQVRLASVSASLACALRSVWAFSVPADAVPGPRLAGTVHQAALPSCQHHSSSNYDPHISVACRLREGRNGPSWGARCALF